MLRYATGNLPIIYHIIFMIGVFLVSRTPLPPTASIVYYLLVEAVVWAGFKGKSTACANLFRSTENRKSLFEAFSPPIDSKSYSLMAYYHYYHRRFREKKRHVFQKYACLSLYRVHNKDQTALDKRATRKTVKLFGNYKTFS